MTRHLAFVVLVVIVILAHGVAAQRGHGTTSAPGGGSRSRVNVPPPPPFVDPVLTVSPTLPPPSPSAPPIGIAQLPSRGVVQTMRPAGFNPLNLDSRFFVVGNRLVFAGSRDVFRANRFDYANRGFNGGYGTIAGGYYGGGYGYSDTGYVSPEIARAAAEASEVGLLRLEVSPGSAQVYVDGAYVSTVDDFRGTGPARALSAGTHRIEIRADGYETASFDVRIDPNETTTYRRELKADQPAQARNVAPAIPKTFYVIPNCYAGDKPPDKDKLPKGCQVLNVRKVPPVVSKAS